MSYCRWSSNNWDCDLYCYGDTSGGITTHVAGNRVVGPVPKVDWRLMAKVGGDLNEFQRQYDEQMKYIQTAERREIGLSCDGETFHDGDLEGFLRTVTMLRAEGYHVPEGLEDDIRKEIEYEKLDGKGGDDVVAL